MEKRKLLFAKGCRENTTKSPSRSKRGFTLVELLVVLFASSLLALIYLSAMARSEEMSKKERCANNLRLLGKAFTSYASDYDGYLPGFRLPDEVPASQRHFWPHFIKPYTGDDYGEGAWACPERVLEGAERVQTSYLMNASFPRDMWRLEQSKDPSSAFYVGDSSRESSQLRAIGRWDYTHGDMGFIHEGYANLLFLDWHVESRTEEEVPHGEESHKEEYVRFWNPLA